MPQQIKTLALCDTRAICAAVSYTDNWPGSEPRLTAPPRTNDDHLLPTFHKRLGPFALFGAVTGAAVGIVLDQTAAGISVGAACGILFGCFGAHD
jgi:hypothetical protein